MGKEYPRFSARGRHEYDTRRDEELEVHMMLAQKYTSNGYEDVYNDSSRKIVYHLIKTGSYEQRFKLAELFSSYILSKTESMEAN